MRKRTNDCGVSWMKRFEPARGFSLLELLITLAVVAIVAAFSLPSLNMLLQRGQQRAAASELISIINLSRNTAIQEQVSVTLCPINEKGKCSKDWDQPLVAFRDPMRKREASQSDQVLRILDLGNDGITIGRTGIRDYFRFRPSGLAEEAIGNIVWCPKNRNSNFAFQIRINMGGRPLVSKDNDGDGIPEDTYGKPVKCN